MSPRWAPHPAKEGFLGRMVTAVQSEVADGYYDLTPQPTAGGSDRRAPHKSLAQALRPHDPRDVALMIELKHASPGYGDAPLRALPPREFVEVAQEGGADALSVIPQPHEFGGSLDEFGEVSAVSQLPVLFKDFVIDPAQLRAAKTWGATAVLLIARVELERYPTAPLRTLIRAAHAEGLEVLLEVHSASEVPTALHSGADVLGVNARDLDTLAMDPAGALEVLGLLRDDPRPRVGMSGVADLAGVLTYASAGATAVLLGTAFSRARNPRAFLRGLRTPKRSHPGAAPP